MEQTDLASLRGLRAAVCEDEGIASMHLERILAAAGMQVVGASRTGHECVETVLRERPDVVLLDVDMPGVDGLEASRQILGSCRPCVVMVTAHSDADRRERARRLGVIGYVTKPVDRERLLRELVAAVAAHAAQ